MDKQISSSKQLKEITLKNTEVLTYEAIFYFEGRVPMKIHIVNTQELL